MPAAAVHPIARVNFAISTRGRQPGLDHLQVEDK
jgi:hypothetical protein